MNEQRNERLVATIPKNSREEFRVSRGEYKGRDLITMRVWYEDRESGEMRPGKAGITLSIGLVAQIVETIQSAAKDGAP
jgi:hypothetical protein